jgi:hypothetical protein
MRSHTTNFEVDLAQPQLRGLVCALKEPFFGIDELVFRLLEVEKLGNPEIALVIGVACSFENGARVAHERGIVSEVVRGE